MNKLIRFMMLICFFTILNCYPLHSDETDDKIQKIILNIPEVADDITFWTKKYKDSEPYKEYGVYEKLKINIDNNNIPDFIVHATYLQLCGADGGERRILAIVKDLKTIVFKDFYQYFSDVEIIDNIIPDTQCLFYRSIYSHGFADWQSNIVGLWEKPEKLLSLNYFAYESPIGGMDEDNFKFIDLDGDGLKEVILEHINWKYEETSSEDLRKVLNIKEYKVFKFDKEKRKLEEIKNDKMVKAASKLYDNTTNRQ